MRQGHHDDEVNGAHFEHVVLDPQGVQRYSRPAMQPPGQQTRVARATRVAKQNVVIAKNF